MKTNLCVEYQGKKISNKEITDKVKDLWKEEGGKVKDLQSIDIYCKPEEGKCYYVINEEKTGSFTM